MRCCCNLLVERWSTPFAPLIGILLGCPLATPWIPGGQAQPANDSSQRYIHLQKMRHLEIKADLYRPHGDGPHPTILWIHDGALIFSSRAMLPAEENDLFLRAGYIVVSIDYRLAPQTKLPAVLEDVEDAFRWVRKVGPRLSHCDPKRLVVVGQSAGAYLTLMSGARVHPSPKVIVSFLWLRRHYRSVGQSTKPILSQPARSDKRSALRSVSQNEISEANVEPCVDFRIYCRQNGLWLEQVAGFDPVKEQEQLEAYGPDRLVTADHPPTFLLHGDRIQMSRFNCLNEWRPL
jgi:acetyl esterase/lipase